MRKFILGAFFAILILLTSCARDPLSPSLTVEYKITGTAEAVNIDYLDSNGDLVIINGVEIPWELTFSANSGDQVYLSAKRTGSNGTVTVTIYSDGNVFDQDTTSDATSATAEGTL
ncbi:MAG: MmpS family transport accessory protein [Candidatus Fermentibacteria bacterium]|nr:MmpS family transport accessory protein [Candidatus Fermentibacteria bacterium]